MLGHMSLLDIHSYDDRPIGPENLMFSVLNAENKNA